MNQTDPKDEIEVDLLQLLRALWENALLMILAAVILGGAAFVYTKLFVAPVYESKIIMYVNNRNPAEQNQSSVSTNDLSASIHLVDTYTVFLHSRTTLDEVLVQAKLPYSYEQLKQMVTASGVNGTQAFEVVAKSNDPQEAALIANTIGDVLPGKIAEFIPGSSAKIVDYAVIASSPSSPNVLKTTILGAILGLFLSSGIVVVVKLMDNEIHDAEYLTQNFEYPVLAVIPDLTSSRHDRCGYEQHCDASDNRAKGGKRNV